MTKGFTLAELSIVLVVIGLLIGGILVGQSLIESAKINAQVKQIQQFDIALNNFYGKYKCIPGDCTNNFSNYTGTLSPGKGNNLINIYNDTNATPPTVLWDEPYLFFINLSFSGALNERYVFSSANYYQGVGNQFPKMAIDNGGGIVVTGNTNQEIFYFLGMSVNGYTGGAATATYAAISPQGVLSPAQALAIDKKMDDGNPLTGKVVAVTNVVNSANGGVPYPMTLESNNATGCINNNIYNTSLSNNNLCRLLIRSDFYK